MKILILGLARSGTTSLLKGLYSSIDNSLSLFEIFNPTSINYLEKNYLNHLNFLHTNTKPLIEKNLISDLSGHIWTTEIFNTLNFNQLSKLTPLFNFVANFHINYSKSFDRVILMSRKNLKESAESWVNCKYYNNFFDTYKFNPNLDIKNKLIELKFYQKVLEDISLKLNTPITYYEDLFTGNKQDLQNFLNKNNIQVNNFEVLYEHLDPKNKLRQNSICKES